MRTLGIDLASKPERTAMVLIDWGAAGAVVHEPESPVDDDMALAAMAGADWTGIDAPFGWPETIVKALPEFANRGSWPNPRDELELRFRITDRFVHGKTRIWPLSVSSDRIAVPAWRCASLLSRVSGAIDRLGERDHVVEVYPGAALTSWGFQRHGYKRRGSAERRAEGEATPRRLLDDIGERGSPWLDLSAAEERCVASDDALDAVIAALVARAAALKITLGPPEDELDVIRREGWIHLPTEDSFEQLAVER
jgi:predicted nuclease with RNAse H fold